MEKQRYVNDLNCRAAKRLRNRFQAALFGELIQKNNTTEVALWFSWNNFEHNVQFLKMGKMTKEIIDLGRVDIFSAFDFSDIFPLSEIARCTGIQPLPKENTKLGQQNKLAMVSFGIEEDFMPVTSSPLLESNIQWN